MTKDDIIRMAREAGLCTWVVPPQGAVKHLERFAALVAAAESTQGNALFTKGGLEMSKPVAYRFKSPLSEEGQWEYGKEPPVGSRWEIEPLYTAPPQRKPLTDEAIGDIYVQWDATPGVSHADFARAIERAHGIGGKDE